MKYNIRVWGLVILTFLTLLSIASVTAVNGCRYGECKRPTPLPQPTNLAGKLSQSSVMSGGETVKQDLVKGIGSE